MRTIRPIHDRASWLAMARAAAVLFVVGCASPGAQSPSRIEKGPEGGFTITQDVRVGLGVRGDFDAGVRLLEEGDAAGAVERLLAVTEAAPGVVAAHVDLGIAYGRLSDWEKAEASLARAVELSPRHPVARNELAIALRRLGRFEEARTHYEGALDSAPEFHFARRNLAVLCDLFLEDLECALEHYERYAETNPGDEDVAMWIADLRRRTEEPPR